MTTAIATWPTTMAGVAERVRHMDADRDVATVADRLREIHATTNGGRGSLRGRHPDGVACFNFMYLGVTEQVSAGAARFEAPAFVARLAVVFAEFYLTAYEANRTGNWVSKAWQPLFEERRNRRVAPTQFALAGMNAHINNDLPWALVQTWDEFGIQPDPNSAEHRDYERVNAILEEVQGAVRAALEHGFLRWLDRVLGRLDDRLAAFSIAKARDEAWERGERWTRGIENGAAAAHDRHVGYDSHLILAL